MQFKNIEFEKFKKLEFQDLVNLEHFYKKEVIALILAMSKILNQTPFYDEDKDEGTPSFYFKKNHNQKGHFSIDIDYLGEYGYAFTVSDVYSFFDNPKNKVLFEMESEHNQPDVYDFIENNLEKLLLNK